MSAERERPILITGGAGFIGLGAAPEWTHDQMPVMPKGRYRLMTDYMGRVGTHGTQMMYRTSTVQVNLDFASEADMVQKLRVALALQPVATALFANSPFLDGRPNGMKSWRAHIWQNLDAARTGMLPFVFEEGTTWASLDLKGDEIVEIDGLEGEIKPREKKIAKITYSDGSVKEVPLLCRIDTLDEVIYMNNGGILQTVLRDLAA